MPGIIGPGGIPPSSPDRSGGNPLLVKLAGWLADKSGGKQLASDAWWSVSHPIDRITGKGRAANQRMEVAWGPAGPLRIGRVLSESGGLADTYAHRVLREVADNYTEQISGLKHLAKTAPSDVARKKAAQEAALLQREYQSFLMMPAHKFEWASLGWPDNPFKP